MKKIIKSSIYAFLAALTLSGCSKSDLLIDQVFDNVDSESGVVLRTIEAPEDLYNNNEGTNIITLTVEVQEGNGSEYPDFKEVRANIRLYADQDLTEPLTGSGGSELPERVVATYLPADFEIGSNVLPRKTIEIPTSDVVALFPDATIPIPTFIALRFEVEMNDGRVYTNENLGDSVTGGTYFDSRFLYKIIFVNN